MQESSASGWQIAAAVFSAGRWLLPNRSLTSGTRHPEQPRLAVDDRGNALVSWIGRDGSAYCGGNGCQRVQIRGIGADGMVSSWTQNASGWGQDVNDHELAVDRDGNVVAAWSRYDGTSYCGGSPGCRRVQARKISAGGVLSARTHTLSALGEHADQPDVGVGLNGHATVVWTSSRATTVRARRISPADELSPTTHYLDSLRRKGLSNAEVGVDQDGDAVVAWQSGDGYCDPACTYVHVATLSMAGTAVSSLLSNGTGLWPSVGIDQDGDAVVAWQALDGEPACSEAGCWRIQAATGP
jgi:hypothetical protein